MPHLLSKSTYISGLQCEKKLYLYKKHKELATPRTVAQEAIMKQGTSMGEVAQLVFPNGKDASPEHYWDFGPAIEQTKAWIAAGETTIYEAAFQADQVMAALDILHHKDGQRIAIEVKSSTSVKDYHLDDAAIQYWVMNQAGFKPDRFFIMVIDRSYERQGKIKPSKLFKFEEVTEIVKEKQAAIPEKIAELKAVLAAEEIPEKKIGPHCSSPFACDFMEHCWQKVPERSVFELNRLGQKAWDFYNQGIEKLTDLEDDSTLSPFQQHQIQAVKKGESYIDQTRIKDFFSKWEYPLYFFDFETVASALPPYDGTHPYDAIAAQYSLHIMQEDGSVEHREFLGEGGQDPRRPLIERMLSDLGTEGSIVAYYMSFEKRIIGSLAKSFPEYAEPLNALLTRFVDLEEPFKNGWYIHPDMQGRSSIKLVLPALFPDEESLDYKSLRIQNGGDASVYLQALFEGRVRTEDEDELRRDLLAYCELDTLAMVKILQKLEVR